MYCMCHTYIQQSMVIDAIEKMVWSSSVVLLEDWSSEDWTMTRMEE